MAKVLLVDDEIALTDSLSRVLRREGYDVQVASDGSAGYNQAIADAFDLFILDWMLPGQSGIDLCRRLREQGIATPVLFLTAKDTIDDRVQGLDSGADDYLVKPFELRELLARVRALIRRSPSLPDALPVPSFPTAQLPAPTALDSGADIELDAPNRIAYRSGQAIELSEKETQLLALFLRSPQQVLSHDEIYQALWGNKKRPSSNAIAAQIRLLRRKIEQPDEAPLIRSVYGRGYRFNPAPSPDPDSE
ncbi:MAG: response regulator transcription factor [Cyanobacteria bacterium P01_H01_bin.130]